MRRSPKENRIGEKSLKLYCSLARSNTTKDDVLAIEESTGLSETCCFFSLAFKFVVESKTWILKTEYDSTLLWHTHPFFHSYSAFKSHGSSRSSSVQQTPANIYSDAKFVSKYFRNYKTSLNKLKQMDIVLDRKAKGLLPPNSNCGGFIKHQSNDDFNVAAQMGYDSDSKRDSDKLHGWRGHTDGITRKEEYEEEN
jgi:hypothetical protein